MGELPPSGAQLRFQEVQITIENRVRQIITSTLPPVKKRIQPENDTVQAISLLFHIWSAKARMESEL